MTKHKLVCANKALDLSSTKVMGILNVTPDSFSDGGKFNNLDLALQHAEQMVNAGAKIIDVGGESTRPGAKQITVQQELDRVLPVIENINSRLDVIISVDTSTPDVMLEAAKLGAGLINDVRSLQRENALTIAKQIDLPVCLMHMQGEPHNMQNNPYYSDVVQDVIDFLAERVKACEQAGINRERLLIDPGFGFGKNLQHNLYLFKHLMRLHQLDLPILVGVSRKKMIGDVLELQTEQRLNGSLALASLAAFMGAKIIRVHDVKETAQAVNMINAVMQA